LSKRLVILCQIKSEWQNREECNDEGQHKSVHLAHKKGAETFSLAIVVRADHARDVEEQRQTKLQNALDESRSLLNLFDSFWRFIVWVLNVDSHHCVPDAVHDNHEEHANAPHPVDPEIPLVFFL